MKSPRLPLASLPLAVLASLALFTGAANAAQPNMDDLIAAAQQEGRVDSLGMPDSWANWKDTWADLKEEYGLEHSDTDMSSAEEIAKFRAEGENASADIGDVGIAFGPIAVEQGVTQPYKPSHWEQIPDWAKDKDGHWALAYTGTIAMIINKDLVPEDERPHAFADLLEGDYSVAVGPVGSGAQNNAAVLAAAYARGGDESDLQPGLELFGDLAEQGRLSLTDLTIAALEKGEIEVGLLWDFNALNYRDQIDRDRFEVSIPSDASVVSGYTTIINKYAPHPNAAKLAREYIFSDAGQANLAKGYARPIRAEHLDFDDATAAKLLPDSEYANARPIEDFEAWEQTSRQLPQLWQSEVLTRQH